MMFLNKGYTAEDIVEYVLKEGDTFSSARQNKEEFTNAVRRMNDAGQVIISEHNGKLDGACGWYFLNEDNKYFGTKITWRLPEDISQGDILYVSFVVLNHTSVLWVKEWFDFNVRKRIKKVRWWYKGQIYEKNIKGVGDA